MRIVHITASTHFGGPERQMLGLAECLRATDQSCFLSFAEGGRCDALLDKARKAGFEAEALASDTPHLPGAARELTTRLDDLQADVVCCHGYKADLLGWWAGRRLGIPVVAVSRGWTWKAERCRPTRPSTATCGCSIAVCVSDGQGARERAGVPRSSTSSATPSAPIG